MQHDHITPRVPPAHAPVRGEGSPAKGPRLQAPPLPSDIRLYGKYLSAYEQYLLGRRELAKLERDLVLVDPKRYVASHAITMDAGLEFSSIISSYTPVTSVPRVPVRKTKAAKPVVPLPTPREAPAVTLPPGAYVPVGALTPATIEEAYNVLCSESEAGFAPSNNFVSLFRPVTLPVTAVPSSLPTPPKAEVVSKTAKSKARRARRKATKATKVLAAMSASQLQEEAKKEKILRATFPKIVVPTIYRSAQGTLQSQAGTPIKYQTTKTALRKRSPSYLRRLARRQLARFAKPTAPAATPTKAS